jgi:hypothetical protein
MLVMIDSFVERDPLLAQIALAPMEFGEHESEKCVKGPAREGWFRGRVEARVSCHHFAGRRVSQFANMNRFLGIWESLVTRRLE